jgi:thiol peroxidase
MAQVTIQGNAINTIGDLPANGTDAPTFTLVKSDLSEVSLADFKGKKVVLNIFPSIDTGVCAASVRKFNEEASKLENTVVLCISMDLPFAHSRFCGAENIENVVTLSQFRDQGSFGKSYGIELIDGPFKGLDGRAVVIIDESGKVVYSELVPEIAQEPNYEAAMSAL